MDIRPFAIERWFARYEFSVKYNIAESGVRPFSMSELEQCCGVDTSGILEGMGLGYTDNRGTRELREEIAKLYPGRGPEHVLVTTGAVEANFLVFSALVSRGDPVVSEFPAYQQLYEVPRANGGKVSFWHLREENNYRPDISQLEDLTRDGVKMIVINHPHNPTGAAIDAGSMAAVCEIAEQHGAILVSDEVYRGVLLSEHVATPSAQAFSDRAITVGSMSKAYGLPGLRIGWIVGPADLVERCATVRDYTSICPAAPSQALAIAALRGRERVLARSKAIARKNLAILDEWVRDNSDIVAYVPPREGVLAWVRYASPVPSLELATALAEDDGVLVVPGACFECEGYLRVGLGSEVETLEAGLGLLARRLRSAAR